MIDKEKLRNIFNKFKFGADEQIIQELKSHFEYGDRVGYYKGKRFHCEGICCEATPGLLENAVLLIEKLKQEKGCVRLLNIGSGTSQFNKIISSLDNVDVYNADILIENEDNHNKWCDLNQQDPIPYTEKFDVVLAQEVIEHIENPWKFVRDIASSLEKGGYIIISTPNVASLQSKIKFLFSSHFAWFTPECLPYHINPIPYWEMEVIAERTGFEMEQIIGSGDYFFSRNKKKNKKRVVSDNESLIFLLRKKN